MLEPDPTRRCGNGALVPGLAHSVSHPSALRGRVVAADGSAALPTARGVPYARPEHIADLTTALDQCTAIDNASTP